MATALGTNLVFNVTASSTEFGEALNGATDIKGRGAEAGININDQRCVANIGDPAHVSKHVVKCVDAKVGQT